MKEQPSINLIVGLGNPGSEHTNDRHNIGFWFVEKLIQYYNGPALKFEKKFHGNASYLSLQNHKIHLLCPMTFMNRSGQAVVAMTQFYQIPIESVLVVHDEIDFPPGFCRLKKGGGHAGHNGLRDIIQKTGNNNNFLRLRLGVGHPGHHKDVSHYVLTAPSKTDYLRLESAIENALHAIPLLLKSWEQGVHYLHSSSLHDS